MNKIKNIDYFNNINSSDKAYYLGMIFGCGSNCIEIREVRVNSKTANVANQLYKIFYETDLKENEKKFKIYAKDICTTLEKYSLSNKKNETMRIPEIEFKDDFVAGYIENSSSFKDDACYVSGSIDILNDIKNHLGLDSKITKNAKYTTGSMYIKKADWNMLKTKLTFKNI